MKKSVLYILLFAFIISSESSIAQYRKISSNNLDIYFRIIGDGQPILIIGGGPGDNSNRYLSLCELISQEFQCILVDQRGTGKSIPDTYDSTTISISLTLEDFEAIRKNLKIKEWAVLGFSYGGFLASLYANYYPSSVSHLILLESMGLNTDVFGYFLDNINSKLADSDFELFEYWNDSVRVAENPHHALVERIRTRIPGYFYNREKSLIISEAMKDSDFNFEVGQWIWGDIEKNNLDLTKMESKFNNPVLIIHGRQDPLGESIPQSLVRYYKNSKLVFIEKAGHYSWIEQPDEIYRLIKIFFATK
ncbi:alpha/beta fold hydrolase [Candidatus Neomarinimicrobiota bacterium]